MQLVVRDMRMKTHGLQGRRSSGSARRSETRAASLNLLRFELGQLSEEGGGQQVQRARSCRPSCGRLYDKYVLAVTW